jgi:hypothetical protein
LNRPEDSLGSIGAFPLLNDQSYQAGHQILASPFSSGAFWLANDKKKKGEKKWQITKVLVSPIIY